MRRVLCFQFPVSSFQFPVFSCQLSERDSAPEVVRVVVEEAEADAHVVDER